MTRLMKHPHYREAHATDDHFMSAMFVSGAVGDEEDIGFHGKLMAEDWELVSTEPGYISTSTTDHVQTNMCNSQFSFGSWETDRRQAISST